jgi:hypothetical protein
MSAARRRSQHKDHGFCKMRAAWCGLLVESRRASRHEHAVGIPWHAGAQWEVALRHMPGSGGARARRCKMAARWLQDGLGTRRARGRFQGAHLAVLKVGRLQRHRWVVPTARGALLMIDRGTPTAPPTQPQVRDLKRPVSEPRLCSYLWSSSALCDQTRTWMKTWRRCVSMSSCRWRSRAAHRRAAGGTCGRIA